MPLSADEVFRDFNQDGVPSSGYHYPTNAMLRDWGGSVDSIAASAGAARDAAIDAKDIAEGYASDAVSQGNVPIYSSRAAAAALEIPAAITVIRVNGYASSNDGGAAYYRHAASEPSHPGKFQDADDQWWQLYEQTVNPFMFGAVSGASTDCIDELRDCLNYCKAMIDDGRKRMVLDLVGQVWAISDTWSFNERVDYLTVKNGVLKALDVAWLDVDTSMNNYYDTYETVTAAGETWSLRKPLVKCAGSNPGLTFDRVDLNGDRKAAGVLSEDSAQERRWQNSRFMQCRSYSVHMSGPMDIIDCELRPAASNTADRDAYGIVIDTAAARVINTRARWAHCLLLTTGGENIITGCDFENGEDDASGNLPTLLWENRAADNLYCGGRLRNGQIRTWVSRMAVVGTTCGNDDEQYWKNFFRFYATSANSDLSGFVFQPSNIPSEMVDGSTYWFNFATSGQGSWAIDTTNIGLIQGYPAISGGVTQIVATGTSSTALIARTSTDGAAKIKMPNNNVTNTEAAWVGGNGQRGELGIANDSYWWWNNDGNFFPSEAGGGTIGTESRPIYKVHAQIAEAVHSDGRWKEARDFTEAELDAALTIRSKAYYRLNDDGSRIDGDDLHFGVIAQDVAEAFGGAEAALRLGVLHQDENGRMSVSYTELDQIRIEAEARERQRLTETILSLKSRIDQMEAKNG